MEGAGLPEPVAGSTVTATIAVCPFPSVIVTLHAVFPVIAVAETLPAVVEARFAAPAIEDAENEATPAHCDSLMVIGFVSFASPTLKASVFGIDGETNSVSEVTSTVSPHGEPLDTSSASTWVPNGALAHSCVGVGSVIGNVTADPRLSWMVTEQPDSENGSTLAVSVTGAVAPLPPPEPDTNVEQPVVSDCVYDTVLGADASDAVSDAATGAAPVNDRACPETTAPAT